MEKSGPPPQYPGGEFNPQPYPRQYPSPMGTYQETQPLYNRQPSPQPPHMMGPPPHQQYPPPKGYMPAPMGPPPPGAWPASQMQYSDRPGVPGAVIVQAPTVVQPVGQPQQSFTAHIILSCVVYCCCGWLCGIIAFVLAMLAQNAATAGRSEEARRLGKASIALSIVGIIVGIIAIIVIAVSMTTAQRNNCHYSSYTNSYQC